MNPLPPAYRSIDAFFNGWSLNQARSILTKAIKTAEAEKLWKGRSPASLLFFFEMLGKLLQAAFTLVKKEDSKGTALTLLKENADTWYLAAYETWCGWHGNSAPWHFFPRHLSQKEFINPYIALQKIVRHQPLRIWKEKLKDVLEHALSPHSIFEFDDGIGILASYLHLQKLLEATHLINVRAVLEDENGPRPKWKDGRQNEKSEEPDTENEK